MTNATQKTEAPVIHKHMKVLEIITLFPGASSVMSEYGLHCHNCHVGGVETLEEAGKIHAFDAETVDMLLDDLNEALQDMPIRPQEITITEAAAHGILQIAKEQGHEGKGLSVVVDESGGFCMEFKEKPDEGERVFRNLNVPEVRVYASGLTLGRIGGATIDVRDGRFKLDLEGGCCGDMKKDCNCKD